jgi:ferrous iron transport protein A
MFLNEARRGRRGAIMAVARHPDRQDAEMERRLLEMGFVEGAQIEVLHEGPFGGDPMVVRLDDMRVALRRSEAALVQIGVGGGTP